MIRWRTTMLHAVLAVVLVLVASACSASTIQSSSSESQATFSYSCCRAADADTARHPGDVVTLHWIVTADPASGRPEPRRPVTLSASLHGSHSDVATLKSSSNDIATAKLTAPPIKTTTWAGGAPISRIQLPPNAAAGYYNLTFSVSIGDSDGAATLGGASVIQVVDPKGPLRSGHPVAFGNELYFHAALLRDLHTRWPRPDDLPGQSDASS